MIASFIPIFSLVLDLLFHDIVKDDKTRQRSRMITMKIFYSNLNIRILDYECHMYPATVYLHRN